MTERQIQRGDHVHFGFRTGRVLRIERKRGMDFAIVQSDQVHPGDGHFPHAVPVGNCQLVAAAPAAEPARQEPEQVWISVRRAGIDRHFVLRGHSLRAGVFTYCSRSIRTGELLPADDPWIVAHTKPCHLCWSGGAGAR